MSQLGEFAACEAVVGEGLVAWLDVDRQFGDIVDLGLVEQSASGAVAWDTRQVFDLSEGGAVICPVDRCGGPISSGCAGVDKFGDDGAGRCCLLAEGELLDEVGVESFAGGLSEVWGAVPDDEAG